MGPTETMNIKKRPNHKIFSEEFMG